jgi:hypothetical protein
MGLECRLFDKLRALRPSAIRPPVGCCWTLKGDARRRPCAGFMRTTHFQGRWTPVRSLVLSYNFP